MDILDFCVTDDCVGLHFQVILGPYPSTLINPPIVEIAVNVMNLSGGGTTWYYNPPTFNMQAPFVGVNAIPAYDWEALITTNLTAPGANNGYIHPPGFGAAGIIPMNWVPNAAGPSVLSFTIPWGAPLAQPPIGTKVGYTVMAAHSGNGPLGTNSVPITDPDDVITNAGSGLPDNNSTANEFALDPLISLSTDYESTTTLSGCPMTTVSLTVAAQGVSENAGPALVSIQLSNPSPVDVTVSFTTNDGVAVQPGDYLTTFGQVTFTAGQVLKVIPVTLVNDNCIEPDEPFTFTISNPVNAYLGLALQTITIINDDSLPTIGVSVAAQSVAESVGNAIVEVDLSGSTCQNVTFDYTTSDVTAVQPADYTLISGSRTILAGDTRTTFAIPIVNDVLNELSEDFRFTISNIANATTGTATQTITILDDDPQPQVRLTAAAQSVNENAGPAVVTVELSAVSGRVVTVDYLTANGTAVAPGDYTALPVTTLTFNPGETSKPISVTIIDDLVDENNEDFTFTIQNPVGATLGTAAQTITINDDDPAPTVSIVPASQSVGEAAGTANATVQLSAASEKVVTVEWFTQDGSATAPADYTAVLPTVLTFNPGDTSKPVSVTIINDLINEASEDFRIRLQNPVNTSINVADDTVTINDDDGAPTVSVNPASQNVNENAGTAKVVIELSAPSGLTITVDYLTSNGLAIAPFDYTATLGTATFLPGDIRTTITVPIINDLIDEPVENFFFRLLNPINAGLGATPIQTININDDDPPPSVFVNPASQAVLESIGNATVEVDLSTSSGLPVTVTYGTSNGTAVQPQDYTNTGGTVTFLPGEKQKFVLVPIINDIIDENNETFNFDLSAPTNASLGTTPQVVTITDDDLPPVIVMAVATQSVGEAAGVATIEVDLLTTSGKTVSVDYQTANITATQPADYTLTAGTLNFAPGVTKLTFNVPIIDDLINEPAETFNTTLLNPVNGSLGPVASDVVTIIDNDLPPSVSVNPAAQNVNENAGTAKVVVELSAPSGQTVTVDYVTSNGLAIAPWDYTTTLGTITFLPGDVRTTITVPIINDLIDEPAENFFFVLSNPVNAVAGPNMIQQITILDDDPPPTVSVNPAAQTVPEPIGNATVEVDLSTSSGFTVTVDYTTADGTALQPADYTSTFGTLTFLPGETQKFILVPIINDIIDEFNETFSLGLNNATNAVIGVTTQTLTIDDDDPPPVVTVTVPAQSIAENAGFVTVTVDLLTTSGKTVSVDYLTSNVTAIAPGDYTTVAGTLTFPPGVTRQSVNVPIINDSVDEYDETFDFVIQNPVNATMGVPIDVVTILDDDPPPNITFVIDQQSVLETVGTVSVDVVLSTPSEKVVTVNYGTVSGTAITPDDYFTTSGLFTYLPGQTTKTITVNITDDVFWEPTEQFFIQLSNYVNCNPGTFVIHTVIILDDDPPPGPYGTKEKAAFYNGEGRDPGKFGKIAHDALGNIHAAYYEDEKNDLKYAFGLRDAVTGNIKWKIQTVDSVGDVGRYCDITVDYLGRPVITYYDATNRTLKIAWDKDADGTFEQNGTIFGRDDSTGFYEIQTVDNTSSNVGTWTSVETDVFGDIHVAYKDETNGKLRYAYYNGSWSLETIDTSATAPIAGRYASIVLNNRLYMSGIIKVYIFYQDEVNSDLEGVVKDPSITPGWVNVGELDAAGDTGNFIDAKLAPPPALDRTYIAYQDTVTTSTTNAVLKFAVYDEFGTAAIESVLSCTPQGINPCPSITLDGDWGYYASVTVDGNGLPAVAHYDAFFGNLLEERRTTTLKYPAPLPPTQVWQEKRRPEVIGDLGKYTSSDHDTFFDPSTSTTSDLVRMSFYDQSHTALRMHTTTDNVYTTNTAIYIDGAKVGEWSSIDLDSFQIPYIAYYDNPKGSLYMTRRSGPNYKPFETPLLVDDSSASRARPGDTFIIEDFKVSRADFSQTGPYVSMVVDKLDIAHLAYCDQLRRELNYSVVDYGTSTTLRLDVDRGAERGEYSSLAMNKLGTQFAIAYFQEMDPQFAGRPDPLGNGPQLRVAIGNGFTSGGWTLEAVDNAGDVGRYCSIAYDTSGSLHVAYYDATNYNLKYAKRDILTGTWTKQTVDGGPEIAGLYTSIAVNPTNNRPSIAYYDLTNSALKYAEYNGATWVLTTVDVIGDVGLYTAIRFDALRGNVYVLYYDASFEALKIAAKQITSSSWSKVDTIESGGVGLRPSFVVDNTGHLRMVYYDQQRGDLIYRKTLSLPLSGVEGDWTLYQ